MNAILKSAATAALVAIAAFFVMLTLSVHQASLRAQATMGNIQQAAAAATIAIQKLQPAIAELKPTIVDARRTILIAGGTLNLARDTLRNEQASIREANQETIGTMHNVNALVADVDQSQKEITAAAATTIATMQPLMLQSQQDLATLNLAIKEARPLIENSTVTMANAARISGDLAKITDDATGPHPWWKQIWGYVWAPIKLGATFAK